MKAANCWKAARPLYERSSQRCSVADCDAQLAALDLTHNQIISGHVSGTETMEIETASNDVEFSQVPEGISDSNTIVHEKVDVPA